MSDTPKIPENPPAFPVPDNCMCEPAVQSHPWFGGWLVGMTLRDYFAAKAMQGMAASASWECNFDANTKYLEEAARVAYMAADAMLAERSKQ